jgi:hypothetical protein
MLPFLFAGLLIIQNQDVAPGRVEGLVVDVRTGRPIAGAEIKLDPLKFPEIPSPRPVITDRNGHFLVEGVKPDTYTIMVKAGGYPSQLYGAARTGMLGLREFWDADEDNLGITATLVHVEAGKTAGDNTIRLSPAGTVSGRVLGLDGQPLVSMTVELLRAEFDGWGRRKLEPIVVAATNDRGEYRFFDFSPGAYYVKAEWNRMALVRQEVASGVRGVNATDSNGQNYVPAFYPGSSSIATAAAINVQPGAALTNIDIHLRSRDSLPKRIVRVQVLDAETGQAPAEVSGSGFRLLPQEENSLVSLGFGFGVYPSKSSFEREVTEGRYWLVAAYYEGDGDSRRTIRSGVQQLDVSSTASDVITVLVSPTATISGSVLLDGTTWTNTAPDKVNIRLQSLGVEESEMAIASVNKVDATFSFEDIASGEYGLRVSGLPADAYVREALYNGRDLMKERLSIGKNPSGSLEIAISTKSGQVNGRVLLQDGSPAANVEAVLIPDSSFRHPDRYKAVKTDSAGRFVIRGIAPGDYKLYSWKALERFRYFDGDFVRRFETQGRPLRVEEGSRATADIQLILE